MPVNFYSTEFLAKKFKVDRRKFHREIKQIIINDFKRELLEEGIKNPDIGLDENNNIYLADSNHSTVIETNLNISAYL
jgi:hypothetical protein